MEYIAIRENIVRAQLREQEQPLHQHTGESFAAQIPDEITPEFV
jgi:phosphomethylpyrimidine synthase